MIDRTLPVAEPFQSLLRDIREATQTLANCAAKGPLQKDGTRMPIQAPVRNYDPKCEDLAAEFLEDHKPFSRFEKEELAQTIQDAIEDWFLDRENRLLEDHE